MAALVETSHPNPVPRPHPRGRRRKPEARHVALRLPMPLTLVHSLFVPSAGLAPLCGRVALCASRPVLMRFADPRLRRRFGWPPHLRLRASALRGPRHPSSLCAGVLARLPPASWLRVRPVWRGRPDCCAPAMGAAAGLPPLCSCFGRRRAGSTASCRCVYSWWLAVPACAVARLVSVGGKPDSVCCLTIPRRAAIVVRRVLPSGARARARPAPAVHPGSSRVRIPPAVIVAWRHDACPVSVSPRPGGLRAGSLRCGAAAVRARGSSRSVRLGAWAAVGCGCLAPTFPRQRREVALATACALW